MGLLERWDRRNQLITEEQNDRARQPRPRERSGAIGNLDGLEGLALFGPPGVLVALVVGVVAAMASVVGWRRCHR
ncbi:MAG: hypothetical protein AAFP84_04160 [Actinomycetota bacterium]